MNLEIQSLRRAETATLRLRGLYESYGYRKYRMGRFEENSTAESKEEVLTSMEPSAYCFTIPTLSGSVAKVIIPQNVTEKDLDFITLYIENMLPTFISNLKEELEK